MIPPLRPLPRYPDPLGFQSETRFRAKWLYSQSRCCSLQHIEPLSSHHRLQKGHHLPAHSTMPQMDRVAVPLMMESLSFSPQSPLSPLSEWTASDLSQSGTQ